MLRPAEPDLPITPQTEGRTASYRPATNRLGASPGRRAGSLLLALAIEILLLLAFFTLDFQEKPRGGPAGDRLTTFDLPAPSDQDRSSRTERDEPRQAPRPVRPASPIPRPAVELPERPLDLLIVSKEVYEASDISKLGSNAPGYQKSAASSRSGQHAGDSERVGTAPDGEPLYAAEWYREPTDQELGAYLPKSMPEGGGWGLIACKTADRYRVTDCVELGNSPPGSHLAGAVRQAAWQFLVRPPRVGGKPMIGEWVRIRIDYSPGPADRKR